MRRNEPEKDSFDQKREMYSIKNINSSKLNKLTNISSDSFDPLAAIYTDKKYTGRPSDCVSQLMAKWDREDGKIKEKTEPKKTGMWKNEKRNQEIEERKKTNWKFTVLKWQNENWIRGKGRKDYQRKKPDPDDIEDIQNMVRRVSKQIQRENSKKCKRIKK